MVTNEDLEHAVLNQIESDFEEQEYDAISELLQKLIEIPEARQVLVDYLSDTAALNLAEGLTQKRY